MSDPKRPSDIEIINGGAEISVLFNGDKTDPAPKPVQTFVRIVPPRSIRGLALAFGSEDLEIEVYLGLKGEELTKTLNTLHPDGWEAVVNEGRRLNSFNLARYLDRSREAAATINGPSQPAVADAQAAVATLAQTPEGRAVLARAAGVPFPSSS